LTEKWAERGVTFPHKVLGGGDQGVWRKKLKVNSWNSKKVKTATYAYGAMPKILFGASAPLGRGD